MSQYRRPSEDDLLALARMVAKVAHSGQTREGNGEPYFNHVERVAEYVREHYGERAAIVAFLHDTIEDTTITQATLLALGFPARIIHDVRILTRGAGEEYLHYIGRVVEYGSEDALRVKLTDLSDNLFDLDGDDTRRKRYLKAQAYILDALEQATAA